ncbi:MAG: hypothetical protein EBT21_01890 [Actinobacteria bacterium]|nr:hypothetical protein [Actinomycetota bacterium]
MRKIFAAIVIVGFFGSAFPVAASMSSASYEIQWDTVGNGGDDASSSGSYILRDTIGNAAVGDGSSTNYGLRAGYRHGVFDQLIDFSYFAENGSVSVGANSIAGSTISCDSAVGLSVGDMVALIQDRGASQVSAIGMITSIAGSDVTVDELKDGGTSPVIDGTDDSVVLLDGTDSGLDTLSSNRVRTSILGWNVHAETDTGYVVQIMADGDLRDGSATVDAVSDGEVTVGSEEYGARSSDTTLADSTFDSEDTAFTTSFQDVADSSDISYADRNFLTLKAAVSSSTSSGSYAQSLTLIVSGKY